MRPAPPPPRPPDPCARRTATGCCLLRERAHLCTSAPPGKSRVSDLAACSERSNGRGVATVTSLQRSNGEILRYATSFLEIHHLREVGRVVARADARAEAMAPLRRGASSSTAHHATRFALVTKRSEPIPTTRHMWHGMTPPAGRAAPRTRVRTASAREWGRERRARARLMPLRRRGDGGSGGRRAHRTAPSQRVRMKRTGKRIPRSREVGSEMKERTGKKPTGDDRPVTTPTSSEPCV